MLSERGSASRNIPNKLEAIMHHQGILTKPWLRRANSPMRHGGFRNDRGLSTARPAGRSAQDDSGLGFDSPQHATSNQAK